MPESDCFLQEFPMKFGIPGRDNPSFPFLSHVFVKRDLEEVADSLASDRAMP